MKIFFAGAIRGGRTRQPEYAAIIKALQQYGTVLSEHVADETISSFGETDVSKEEVHDRELASLTKSDVLVAEVTSPSLGVGYLIAQALVLGKQVVCLYNGKDTYKLSAMIKGNKKVMVCTYQNNTELIAALNSVLKPL